jgi:hypothetical protein
MILLAYISENHYNKEDQLIRQIFSGIQESVGNRRPWRFLNNRAWC